MYIEWLDHISFNQQVWRDEDDYEELKPAEIRTIGWVLKENEKTITVIHNWHHAEDYTDKFSGEMCILKGCIKTLKEINLD